MLLNFFDQSNYGDLYASLYNQFTRDTDQYPQSLTGAYNTVNEHRKERVVEPKKTKPKTEDEITPFYNIVISCPVQTAKYIRMWNATNVSIWDTIRDNAHPRT